ncbi:AEC family transporter [Paenibacillus cremeus]|uniref:AEC family transporter n=1 Tax=Paenibacillus cremeus TaxID=2163881 RepID=A0A559K8W6_9BACL|nr:AEC family transporter [Paenibacillus cremeus]TVY08570.1 AEC family transporter [Paenibacillus cremeus]
MLFPALLPLIGALAAMVAIGAALSRKIRFEGEVKQAFVTLIMQVTMPCLMLSSLLQLPVDAALLRQIGLVLLLSLGVHAAGIVLGLSASLPLRISAAKRKELAVLGGLGNTGFIGIPMCALLFGPKGALLAAVFDMGLDLVLWTFVVFWLKTERVSFRHGIKSVLNMPMLAVVTGLLLASLKLEPPAFVLQLLGMLGSVTVPLAMLYIGLLLAQLLRRKAQVSYRLLPVPLAAKLLLLPLAVALLLRLSALERELAQVVLLQSAMPTLTIASILFAQCAADDELAALTTACSTVLSLVSVPLLLAWLGA